MPSTWQPSHTHLTRANDLRASKSKATWGAPELGFSRQKVVITNTEWHLYQLASIALHTPTRRKTNSGHAALHRTNWARLGCAEHPRSKRTCHLQAIRMTTALVLTNIHDIDLTHKRTANVTWIVGKARNVVESTGHVIFRGWYIWLRLRRISRLYGCLVLRSIGLLLLNAGSLNLLQVIMLIRLRAVGCRKLKSRLLFWF